MRLSATKEYITLKIKIIQKRFNEKEVFRDKKKLRKENKIERSRDRH